MWDEIWLNARLATMRGQGYGAIEEGALGVDQGRIAYAGAMAGLPEKPEALARTVHDAEGRWITPGLIDCHTHLVFAGNRAQEFELRRRGASYEQIAKAGGGILSSVRAVREASEERLIAETKPRLNALKAEGVTTVEIKSGYGLDCENERKMLRAARRLGKECGVRVRTSYLGLHALPEEFRTRRGDFVRAACATLEKLAGERLADMADAYCEGIAFSREETEEFFTAAAKLNIPVRLHADQLSDYGGAQLAAKARALSADHLEYANEEGILAMAKAGTVAVLLPGAYFALGETQLPPIGAMRRHGAAMAVASDCNPGTSPLPSLLTALALARTQFGLSGEEALAGATRHAARALGLDKDCGTLEEGKRADFALWNVASPEALSQWTGGAAPDAVTRAPV